MHSPYLRNGDLCSTSLKVEYLHKLFGIVLHRFVFYPFIYSIIYLYQYGLLSLFCTLAYNLVLLCLYFLFKLL